MIPPVNFFNKRREHAIRPVAHPVLIAGAVLAALGGVTVQAQVRVQPVPGNPASGVPGQSTQPTLTPSPSTPSTGTPSTGTPSTGTPTNPALTTPNVPITQSPFANPSTNLQDVFGQIPSANNNWLLSGATRPRSTVVTLADGRRFTVIAVRSLSLFERHYRDWWFAVAARNAVELGYGGYGDDRIPLHTHDYAWWSDFAGLNLPGLCDPNRKNPVYEPGVDRQLLTPEQAVDVALRDRAQFEMTAQSAAAHLLAEAARRSSSSADNARIEAARILDIAADDGDNTTMHRALAAILRATRRDAEAGVLAFSDMLRADPTVAFIHPPDWMTPSDRGGWVGVGSALASEAKSSGVRAADWHILAAYMFAQNPAASAALLPNASRQLIAEATLARRGIERQLQEASANGAPATLIEQLRKSWCGTPASPASPSPPSVPAAPAPPPPSPVAP